MKPFLVILLLAVSTFAQTPDNDALFGTPNLRDDSARIKFASSTDTLWSLSAYTFHWDNGPAGDVNYLNDTFALGGYNVDRVGQKVIPGAVSFTMLSAEAKYRNGIAGQPGGFMSEFHFNWESPNGLINVRPFGWNVQYDTGNTDFSFRGEIRFFRHKSNGGANWGIWYDDGALDLATAPNPAFTFPNNFQSLRWRNADNSNSLNPLYVDNQNRTILGVGGGGSDVYVQSNIFDVNNMQLGSMIILRSQPSTKIQMSGFYTWIYSNDEYIAAFSKYQVNLYKPLIVDIAQITSLKIKDGDTLLTVGIGAANSCGTGFRCLRVSN